MPQATARRLEPVDDVAADPAAELADAQREMSEAAELLSSVEARLAQGEDIPAARHHELADLKRFAETRLRGIRARIAESERRKRLAALRAVADDVQALADSGPLAEVTNLEGALQALADAAGRVRALTAEHDRQQYALVRRAEDLQAGDTGPSGRARQASGEVAVTGVRTGMEITARGVRVGAVLTRVESAIAAAVKGSPADGVALLAHVVTRLALDRAPHYLTDLRSGQVFPVEQVTGNWADGIRDHRLRELKPAEVDAYLAGEELPGDAA